jgi:hypothetical protein
MKNFLSSLLANIIGSAELRVPDAVACQNIVDSTLLPQSRCDGQEWTGRLMAEPAFKRAISLERKRAERAGNPALLLLLDLGTGDRKNGNSNLLAGSAIAALLSVVRETDLAGWYSHSRVLGAVFTELPSAPKLQESVSAIVAKTEAALRSELQEGKTQVRVSSRLFSGPGGFLKKKPSSTFLPPDRK